MKKFSGIIPKELLLCIIGQIDAIIWIVFAGQYFIYLIPLQIPLHEHYFLFFGVSFFAGLLIICPRLIPQFINRKFETKKSRSIGFILLGGTFGLFIACLGTNIGIISFYSGPFRHPMLILNVVVFALNVMAVWLIIRKFRQFVQFIHNYHQTSLDQIKDHCAMSKLKILGYISLIMILFGGGIGIYFNFGGMIVIRAPDSAQTQSSFWGTPDLYLVTKQAIVQPIATDHIWIHNSTLIVGSPEELPSWFGENSFAYIVNITHPTAPTINFGNYSLGAKSFSNGTVKLANNLPDLSPINITFTFVQNHRLLANLAETKSKLILNTGGNYIYNPDFFAQIQDTYIFQLLDTWNISYFMSIDNGIDFPQVFNYGNSIPVGYATLSWAHMHCQGFLGLSFDFEGGWDPVPPGIPGGRELWPGCLIRDPLLKRYWYGLNEQNISLFEEAWEQYEQLYYETAQLGYSIYAIFSNLELHEVVDGDIDYIRTPTFPISSNPAVQYGIMAYFEDDPYSTYRIYRDTSIQLKILGDKGQSVLMGWMRRGSTHYTDDTTGFERYLQDCLIAQATGIQEIFHAPIYNIQSKWGDNAVIRLHEALNHDPKRTFYLKIPPASFDPGFAMDYLSNLGHLKTIGWIIALSLGIISLNISIFLLKAPLFVSKRKPTLSQR